MYRYGVTHIYIYIYIYTYAYAWSCSHIFVSYVSMTGIIKMCIYMCCCICLKKGVIRENGGCVFGVPLSQGKKKSTVDALIPFCK